MSTTPDGLARPNDGALESETMDGDPNDDRRRYYRIEDEVALSYRVLEGRELERAMDRFGSGADDTIALAATFASTSVEMRRALDVVKRDFPELAHYLEGLNSKLDILARLIVVRESGLPDNPTHEVNLSASGMSFNVTEAIATGSVLELKLLVFPSHICILTLGAVVNCVRQEGSHPQFPFRVGVDFSYIRDSDRELLIRHVVQKQSSELRRRRFGSESEEDDS